MDYITGQYMTTSEWVKELEAIGIDTKGMVTKIYSDDQFPIKAGKTLTRMEHPEFQERYHPSRSAYVTAIGQGKVVKENGYVLTPNNKLLLDICSDFTLVETDVFSTPLPPKQITSETVAVLTYDLASTNYFHWFFDVLPRIHLIQKSGIPIDKYVFNKLSQTFQYETLVALGIDRNQIIECTPDTHLEAKKLIVTSWIGVTSYYPKWSAQFVRAKLMNKFKFPYNWERNKRLYISRTDAHYRRVINETEVIELLKPLGFKSVSLSSLSVAEKVNLFASADVVITPHGAGETNLIFCRPGTKIVELQSNSYVNNIYQRFFNYFNFDYYYLINDAERGTDWEGKWNFKVNLDELSSLLSRYKT
ncbi:glycosyltransferase family 61 protein [Alkalihalobacillus deserti]|uniref:glycosyltransferase family 61 protein n=1 Tax=Alkalihalobacillus deserti TaxID=2879466 RepID=UPI001D143FA2|nr:glycosyltransferase family 61 protein [Alkalihalobacillus deserti]